MTKVILTFETPMSKKELNKLLVGSSKNILKGQPVSFNMLPLMVQISMLIKSKHDTMVITK
jgi:hypothetical protein